MPQHKFDQATISHAGAQEVLARASAKAAELGAPATIAVVDASGLLKAYVRMDGSPLVGAELAEMKARTAVLMGGAETGGMGERLGQNTGLLVRLAAIPGVALLPGGLPLRSEGALVGAVGVSSPTGGADEAVAAAAVEGFGG